MTKMVTRVALLAALCVFGGNTVLAQLQSGRIVGTIYDSQKAGIPGATVTVTNVATNLARSAVTDSEGNYVITPLDPATTTSAQRSPVFRRPCGTAHADRRPGRPRRAEAQSRRAVDRSAGHGRNAAAQHRIGDAERGHHERADRGSSAQRQRLSRACPAHFGRRAAAADRQHAARPPRSRQRQRHRRRRRLADTVSPRRRGHHRRASGRAPGFRPPSTRFRSSAFSRMRIPRNSTAPAPRST